MDYISTELGVDIAPAVFLLERGQISRQTDRQTNKQTLDKISFLQ